MKITISVPLDIPSWNQVKDWHWTEYQKRRNIWYLLMASEIRKLPARDLKVWKELCGENPKFRLRVISKRRKFLDYSNMCYKFGEDALKGKLIPDDSPKYITSVDLQQELVKKKGVCETVFIIELL